MYSKIKKYANERNASQYLILKQLINTKSY